MRFIKTSESSGYFIAESEDERRAMEDTIREEGKFWKDNGCHCENPSVYFVDNDECDCGISKHHWHCAKCHGIVQIG